MRITEKAVVFFWWIPLFLNVCSGDLFLDQEVMKLARTTIEMEEILYNDKDFDTYPLGGTPVTFSDGIDAAIALSHDGYCHVNFRGSTYSVLDWWQNFNPTTSEVCSRSNRTMCCKARTGFIEGYFTSYTQELEDWIDDCILQTCPASGACLVISGHSQGSCLLISHSLQSAFFSNRFVFQEVALLPSLRLYMIDGIQW